MKTNIDVYFAAVGLLALSATFDTSVASERVQQKSATTSPLAAYGAAVSPSKIDARYDSGCSALYPRSSLNYHKCLQHIPASALVGGGGY
jgi:hypothetical protein